MIDEEDLQSPLVNIGHENQANRARERESDAVGRVVQGSGHEDASIYRSLRVYLLIFSFNSLRSDDFTTYASEAQTAKSSR
jgi:hypothetical protein